MTTALTTATSQTLAPTATAGLDQNPAFVYLSGLNSPAGRSTMAGALAIVASHLNPTTTLETFPWASLRFQHVQAIRAWLLATYKPATVNKYLAALRGTLRAAWQLGQLSTDEYMRAADVKGVSSETLPAGREMTQGEIAAIMAHCENDHTPAGARDAALFAVEYGAGLRRAEIVELDLADYNPDTGEMRITGKGRKERIAWVTNGARDAVGDWLRLRGNDPGPLFVPVNKGGRVVHGQRMTPQAVYNLLRRRATAAGVKHFSPHDLRRTFVSNLLDAGADISTVQKLAGHSNVATTQRYDRRGEVAKRRAAELLHVPYHKRLI